MEILFMILSTAFFHNLANTERSYGGINFDSIINCMNKERTEHHIRCFTDNGWTKLDLAGGSMEHRQPLNVPRVPVPKSHPKKNVEKRPERRNVMLDGMNDDENGDDDDWDGVQSEVEEYERESGNQVGNAKIWPRNLHECSSEEHKHRVVFFTEEDIESSVHFRRSICREYLKTTFENFLPMRSSDCVNDLLLQNMKLTRTQFRGKEESICLAYVSKKNRASNQQGGNAPRIVWHTFDRFKGNGLVTDWNRNSCIGMSLFILCMAVILTVLVCKHSRCLRNRCVEPIYIDQSSVIDSDEDEASDKLEQSGFPTPPPPYSREAPVRKSTRRTRRNPSPPPTYDDTIKSDRKNEET